jgi:hypothetical protein
VLDRLDAHRIVVDVERARFLARRRTDAAGELRKIVRRVQHVERLAPLLQVDEIVPVRNDVVDGAAALAERDAAIHAARALLRRGVVVERDDELAIVGDALLGGSDASGLRASSMKPVILPISGLRPECGVVVGRAQSRPTRLRAWLRASRSCGDRTRGLAAAFAAYISVSARLYSVGNTLTNLRRAASQSSTIASASVLP